MFFMEPLVSVVTSTFNIIESGREDDFEKLCQSISVQTYKNIEHVIVDGNSDDGTRELLKKYAGNERVKYISEPDGGIFDAFNKGVRLAGGKYIIFMGSDDYFYSKDAVQCAVNALELNNADFSYGDVYLLNETKPQKSRISHGNLHEIFFRMSFCHQSVFMRKDILEKYSFDSSYKISADYDLCLRLIMNNGKSVKVNAVVSVFRTGGASSNEKIFNEERLKIFKNRFCLNDYEALFLLNYKVLPFRKVKEFAQFFNGTEKFRFYLAAVFNFLHYLRGNIIRIRTSKGKESFILFGKELLKKKI